MAAWWLLPMKHETLSSNWMSWTKKKKTTLWLHYYMHVYMYMLLPRELCAAAICCWKQPSINCCFNLTLVSRGDWLILNADKPQRWQQRCGSLFREAPWPWTILCFLSLWLNKLKCDVSVGQEVPNDSNAIERCARLRSKEAKKTYNKGVRSGFMTILLYHYKLWFNRPSKTLPS